MKVVLAMSGGVDSSVAAAILKQEGYEVVGVTMLFLPPDKLAGKVDSSGGCCRLDAVEDARRVAYKLGIPHYVMDFRDIFARKVIADFCEEYGSGRTPNPCIRCNRYIKFGALLERAKAMGIDFVATGHYAKVEKNGSSSRYLLKKGIDRRKDQSYFLYQLTQEQLAHTLFPAGSFTKEKIRKIAGELNLPVAAKPESQEICFIPDNDYAGFLKNNILLEAEPGLIVNSRGAILGRHRGLPYYTIGQRRRLGISAERPLYVIAIDRINNSLVVGGKEETYGDELTASALNWITVTGLEQPVTVKARIRYRHREAEAIITPLGRDRVNIKFSEPQMAITPGQSVVFYEGDNVVGGGIIEQAGK